MVGCNHGRTAAVLPRPPSITTLGAQSFGSHQAGDAIAAAALAQLPQVVMDLAIAVNAAALQPRVLDAPEQSPIGDCSGALRLGTPRVVATRMNVGMPAGGFVRFAVANLTTQWTLLVDAQGLPLPVAARHDGKGLAIWWLPYDGPASQPAGQIGGGLRDADYAAALQKLSQTRYQGLMDAAWGIGGWSTHRAR